MSGLGIYSECLIYLKIGAFKQTPHFPLTTTTMCFSPAFCAPCSRQFSGVSHPDLTDMMADDWTESETWMG